MRLIWSTSLVVRATFEEALVVRVPATFDQAHEVRVHATFDQAHVTIRAEVNEDTRVDTVRAIRTMEAVLMKIFASAVGFAQSIGVGNGLS